jgi:hypothetical protein
MILLALVVACITWTITNEEIFRELRDVLRAYAHDDRVAFWKRKLAYLPTCQYCFSHWIAVGVLWMKGFNLYSGWSGYFLTLFVIVALANGIMTVYELFRQFVRLIRLRGHELDATRHRR